MLKHNKTIRGGMALIMVGVIFMLINSVFLQEFNRWLTGAQIFFCVVGLTITVSEVMKRRKADKEN
ncbi:MAG: hypothetical protein LBC03_05015 [Nitrososphaerota archaeon]|jgi:hypothetical protein|nr:hypothetical protein [Nitrososphaerota archaeon]